MGKEKIGFIGLGLMGGAMVSCLQDNGYEVTVLGNRDRTQIDQANARGATEAANAKEVAEANDIVMLCMGTSDQVEARMRGPEGVLAGLSPGMIVIDFGTSLPASTRALAEEVKAAGGTYLDSPIGRTPVQALDGMLNLMGAGDAEAFERARPVLEVLGENVFHLGEVGSGHTIKLINNFFSQTVANALAEAFAMADVTGIERQKLFDVMFAGPLGSPFMQMVAAYALEGDASKLAFSLQNAAKDVGYYDQMAKDAGAQSLIAPATLAALQGAVDDGMGARLVPEVLDYYRAQFERG
ncbi:MAG: NAD(P)-dependent oxidoreductase [Arenibacterium sp.]